MSKVEQIIENQLTERANLRFMDQWVEATVEFLVDQYEEDGELEADQVFEAVADSEIVDKIAQVVLSELSRKGIRAT